MFGSQKKIKAEKLYFNFNFIFVCIFIMFLISGNICSGTNAISELWQNLASTDFPQQAWEELTESPEIGDYGVGVVGSDSAVFIANSRQSSYVNFFMEWKNPGIWLNKPTPSPMNPYKFRNAVAMAWDPDSDCIYALLGGSYGSKYHWFFRYDIKNETWVSLQSTEGVQPNGQGAGDAMTYVPRKAFNEIGAGYLYCFIGRNESEGAFARYNIGLDEWEALSMPSFWVGSRTDDGASLVWAGGDYLYALQGEEDEYDPNWNFTRYDLLTGEWAAMDSIPSLPWSGGSGGVGDGGSLLWVGGSLSDYIFALSGNQVFPEPIYDTRFYCYHVPTNTWEVIYNSLPRGVGDQNGPRLAFSLDHIYCWRGCASDPSFFMNRFTLHIIARLSLSQTEFHKGDTVPLRIHAGNAGTQTSNLMDAYIDAILPNGKKMTIKKFQKISFTGNYYYNATLPLKIPKTAPLGQYALTITLKDHDSGLIVCTDKVLLRVISD